jgi:alkylation response protein AidB-like acyl-CoA dehydrogenase
VDFELSDDQVALAEGVRAFCAGRLPMEVVRGLADRDGVDRGLWRELADLGLFSLRLPAADGGTELGWADAAIAFEQLGRALVPGPLVWTHLVAGLVAGVAEGDLVVGGIERDDPTGLVEHARALDRLVVVDDAGLWVVDAAALRFEPFLRSLDPLTPVARVAELPQGERVLDAAAATALRLQGAVLTAALALGVSQASVELAVAYALDRTQFGRPIGSFQALKHLMADMLVRTELARAAVYAAGVTLDDPAVGSVERAVAAAKVMAGDAALGNARTCVQVHGGMGFTWEVDAHLHLKRAYVLESAFGERDSWSDVLAGLVATA